MLAAAERVLAARAARDLPGRLLLIERGAPDLGVAPALVTPDGIARQIALLSAALDRQGDRLASVLLIGGPEIVPFHPAENPTPYDGDAVVPGDCYYGASNPYALLPDWPVGRIPGAAGADPRLLIQLLGYAAGFGALTPRRKIFGYATAVWQRAAAGVYAEVDRPERLVVSPPTVAATLDRARLDGARLVYCNLHGVPEGPPWYGQSANHPALVPALRPSDLAGLDLHGAIVISEACYGAAIAGRDADSSLALAFLERGAAAFVGATAISYGPTTPPPGEADLIALHFLRALGQPGTTIGAAFLEARAGMLRDTMARQGALDEDDQKTLLEFVLYGDPTLVVL
ncbi:C25 family cysteine peptidase [Kouleothrix sp.]|uniref:C25 family cysteine peptidase n=1 Tax=Kouleothrix sp. TaxID=2779161 RepID=UPI00391B0AF4